MSEFEMEEKLRQHGFTLKEIAILREVSARDKVTYLSMLIDLRKRFFKACGFLVFFNSLLLLEMLFGNDPNNRESLIVSAIFFSAAIYFLTSFKMALKAFIFLLKNRNPSQ